MPPNIDQQSSTSSMVDPTPPLRRLLAARQFAPADQIAPAPENPDLTPLADHIHSSVQNSDTDRTTTTVCTSTPPTMPMIPSSQGRLPRSGGRPRSGAETATVLSEVGLVYVAMEAGSNGPRNDEVRSDARRKHTAQKRQPIYRKRNSESYSWNRNCRESTRCSQTTEPRWCPSCRTATH